MPPRIGQGAALAAGRAVIHQAQALRSRLRRRLAGCPALYLPLRRWRAPGTILADDTDLVIEGFPRSANTWAEAVVRHMAPDLRLAHHSHAAAHVLEACRRKIPCLVVFRAPDDAVRSLAAMFPGRILPREAYADYAAFYTAILKRCGPTMLLAPFEQVTGDPDFLLQRLRERFDLRFRAAPVCRAEVLREMRARELRRQACHPGQDADVCLPRAARRSGGNPSALDLKDPRLQEARRAALTVFDRLCAVAA